MGITVSHRPERMKTEEGEKIVMLQSTGKVKIRKKKNRV